ncbi:helix-turn-helix domain-containing protein [Gordonia sp. NPDC003504]
MTGPGHDRIRELLDAVLDDDNDTLATMAEHAHSSAFHFGRQVSRYSGEAPLAMRRRVMLERAAWYLHHGRRVTDVAFDSGYESVEGFSRAFARAFGHPPSSAPARRDRGHWLPAPNGIHFHSPTVLYVAAGRGTGHNDETGAGDILAMMIRHDIDDTTALLAAAAALDDATYRRIILPGNRILQWQGDDDSIAHVLSHLVTDKRPWLACIEGGRAPEAVSDDLAELTALHHEVSAHWIALTRDIDQRAAWSDSVIDALCEPPESFVLSQIVAHVLTFAAHRRILARMLLREVGVDVTVPSLDPDPIMWHRNQSGGFR